MRPRNVHFTLTKMAIANQTQLTPLCFGYDRAALSAAGELVCSLRVWPMALPLLPPCIGSVTLCDTGTWSPSSGVGGGPSAAATTTRRAATTAHIAVYERGISAGRAGVCTVLPRVSQRVGRHRRPICPSLPHLRGRGALRAADGPHRAATAPFSGVRQPRQRRISLLA